MLRLTCYNFTSARPKSSRLSCAPLRFLYILSTEQRHTYSDTSNLRFANAYVASPRRKCFESRLNSCTLETRRQGGLNKVWYETMSTPSPSLALEQSSFVYTLSCEKLLSSVLLYAMIPLEKLLPISGVSRHGTLMMVLVIAHAEIFP